MDIGFMVVTYFISLQPISSRITLTSLFCAKSKQGPSLH